MMNNRRPPTGSARRFAVKGTNLRGAITNKTGRTVQYESRAEHALILRLDRDPAVGDYGTYAGDAPPGSVRAAAAAYAPQCQVWRVDGRVELHRIRPATAPAGPVPGGPEAADRHLCRERGWGFVAHVAADLVAEPAFANLLALYAFRPWAYAHDDVADAALRALADGRDRPVVALAADLARRLDLAPGTVAAALGHLLWHGALASDLAARLLIADGAFRADALARLPDPRSRATGAGWREGGAA